MPSEREPLSSGARRRLRDYYWFKPWHDVGNRVIVLRVGRLDLLTWWRKPYV